MKKILAILLAGTLAVSSMAVASAGTAPKRGDVNLDGKVDIVDATTIQNICADLGNYSAEQMTAADADNDGKVIISDATFIQEIVAGLINPDAEEPKELDPAEVYAKGNTASFNFSAELLKSCAKPGKNTFVSPFSVMAALSMTSNGANGTTLEEMEKTLGADRDTLNAYFKAYPTYLEYPDWTTPYYEDKLNYETWEYEKVKVVPATLEIANSLWYNNNGRNVKLNPAFVKDALDYYNSEVFAAPFTPETCDALNGWVNEKTHEMIPEILDEINPDALMYLANAIAFEGDWGKPYDKRYDVREGTFTDDNGKQTTVELMSSTEGTYIGDGDYADGFMKYYKGYNYAFAALLPKEGVKLSDYINSLTGERLKNALKPDTKTYDYVNAYIPKFKQEYDTSLKTNLITMGMPTAFKEGQADFNRMIEYSPDGSPWIGDVLHKTFIDVNETGTSAAAVTVIEIEAPGSAVDEPTKPPKTITVRLDRPFIYMIVNTKTNTPVFIGAMETMGE